MSQFIVLHMEKRMDVSPVLERHIVRMEVRYVDGVREETVWVPDNADEERAHLNRELIARIAIDESSGKTKNLTIQQAVNRRIKEAGIGKVRINQNTCIEIIFSGSPETMCAMSQEQVNAWAHDTLAWAQARWGYENVVSATLHCDEKTPHMHVIVVPIVQGQSRRSASKEKLDAAKGVDTKKYKTDTTKNRLCANEVYTKPLLYGYHTSYAETVGEKYGLSRGVQAEPGSYKNHQSSVDYNRMLAQLEAEKKELIKKLQSDYADMEERQSSQKRKIEQNSAILTKQVEVFKKRQEDLNQVKDNIDKKLEDLESLNSIGLLNYIKRIPNIIKSDIQDRVKGWKGTVQSFKMDTVTVEAEPCDIVRVDMLNGVNKYYLEVRLSDGLVWYNGATEPYCRKKTGETMYMKELASYFKELTPDAQKMVYDLFTKQSSKSANKVNKLHR